MKNQAAKLCGCGIHYVENPVDAWRYYPLIGGHVCEVEAHDPANERGEDSKRVTKKLTVQAKIGIAGIVKASVSYIWGKATSDVPPSSGNWANNASSGDGANSVAAGDYSSCSVEGAHSVAAVVGRKGKARACLGSWIVLAEHNDEGEILGVRCAQIDGEKLKPDTFYRLENGEFKEVE